jgi:TatD DNase family protein
MTIDTHCHLTHRRFCDDVDDAVARAREAGLEGCITIGTGTPDARRCLELAGRHDGFVRCTAGLDPFTSHALGPDFDAALSELRTLLDGGGFCAVGECGLDYHYDLEPRTVQAEQLSRQLALAVELDLPVVIHVREAHDDMARLLAEHPRNRGVIHSFTAGPAEAERYLALGWMLAFNGVLTFKNAAQVRDAARLTPAEMLLVETDSPYLAPVPHRGKRCEPAQVLCTLECLAEVREISSVELARITTENANRLFGRPC